MLKKIANAVRWFFCMPVSEVMAYVPKWDHNTDIDRRVEKRMERVKANAVATPYKAGLNAAVAPATFIECPENALGAIRVIDPDNGSGFEGTVTLRFAPQGFRDIIWCPYSNEPEFLGQTVDGTKPHCPGCNGNYEESTHPFVVHIGKPRYK